MFGLVVLVGFGDFIWFWWVVMVVCRWAVDLCIGGVVLAWIEVGVRFW